MRKFTNVEKHIANLLSMAELGHIKEGYNPQFANYCRTRAAVLKHELAHLNYLHNTREPFYQVGYYPDDMERRLHIYYSHAEHIWSI